MKERGLRSREFDTVDATLLGERPTLALVLPANDDLPAAHEFLADRAIGILASENRNVSDVSGS